MSTEYFTGLGRRKSAIVTAKITHGTGLITVNGRDFSAYFTTPVLQGQVKRSLTHTGKLDSFDIRMKASGGGMVGQADAARLAIARALINFEAELRPTLKAVKLLTRDPRIKERKKPGKRGARRSPQWRKR